MTEDDAQALVLRVFASYLSLMRKVQTTYWCGWHDLASCCAASEACIVRNCSSTRAGSQLHAADAATRRRHSVPTKWEISSFKIADPRRTQSAC